MKDYHYSAQFGEVKKLFEVSTRRNGNMVRLSELYFKDNNFSCVYDLRIYKDDSPTTIGIVMSGYVLRNIVNFLQSYFEAKDNEDLTEQLGYDFQQEMLKERNENV